MKTLVVGVAPYEEIKKRTMAIARGELKPSRSDPKVWFSSIESMAQVLSTKNRLLLEIIATHSPQSISELAELSNREKSNLSRTLKLLETYGLVKLTPGVGKEKVPVLPYEQLKINSVVLQ